MQRADTQLRAFANSVNRLEFGQQMVVPPDYFYAYQTGDVTWTVYQGSTLTNDDLPNIATDQKSLQDHMNSPFPESAKDGKFRWPRIEAGVMRLSPAQLTTLFEGLDWTRVHVRRVRAPQEVL